jgi:hypothetical protein
METSPCNNACELDEKRLYCKGCLRKVEEIRDWSKMTDKQKREVKQNIRDRLFYLPKK